MCKKRIYTTGTPHKNPFDDFFHVPVMVQESDTPTICARFEVVIRPHDIPETERRAFFEKEIIKAYYKSLSRTDLLKDLTLIKFSESLPD